MRPHTSLIFNLNLVVSPPHRLCTARFTVFQATATTAETARLTGEIAKASAKIAQLEEAAVAAQEAVSAKVGCKSL
jgi:hypothetical protein